MSKNWSTIYFSGTGNTKFVAKRFSQRMNCSCYSIEDSVDFSHIISNSDVITLCYPIHHSTAPVAYKKFIVKYQKEFTNKAVVILCTQQFFSGDGAYNITKYLPMVQVLYADHINMPSNIGNIPVYSKLTKGSLKRGVRRANKKIDKAVSRISKGKLYTRGFSRFGHWLGKSQNMNEELYMSGAKENVRIQESCVLCKKCISLCPTNNLAIEDGSIVNAGECTFCWRCVNTCPVQAITVGGLHKESAFQYYVMDEVDTLLKTQP